MTKNIGFTTMSFKPALLSGKVTLSDLFAWGATQGFGWVELRDFELNFSQSRLLAIKADAESHGLRVHYAWDSTSVYEVEDRVRFFQGIDNAALFGEGTCSRVVVAPELMCADRGKIGYSTKEFQVLTRRIHEYNLYAVARGVILVFENSLEPIGGFDALLAAVPGMRMALDTANTFNEVNTGMPLTWTQLKTFAFRRNGQIPYVHLKSSINGETCPDLLADGDVPLFGLCRLLNEGTWLCVELPADESLSSCFERVKNGFTLIHNLRESSCELEPA